MNIHPHTPVQRHRVFAAISHPIVRLQAFATLGDGGQCLVAPCPTLCLLRTSVQTDAVRALHPFALCCRRIGAVHLVKLFTLADNFTQLRVRRGTRHGCLCGARWAINECGVATLTGPRRRLRCPGRAGGKLGSEQSLSGESVKIYNRCRSNVGAKTGKHGRRGGGGGVEWSRAGRLGGSHLMRVRVWVEAAVVGLRCIENVFFLSGFWLTYICAMSRTGDSERQARQTEAGGATKNSRGLRSGSFFYNKMSHLTSTACRSAYNK